MTSENSRRTREENYVKRKALIGIMLPQAKEYLEVKRKGPSPETQKLHGK